VPLDARQLVFEVVVARCQPGHLLVPQLQFQQRVVEFLAQAREHGLIRKEIAVDDRDDLTGRREPGAIGTLHFGRGFPATRPGRTAARTLDGLGWLGGTGSWGLLCHVPELS
jgi:hypothetical protein